MPNFIPPFNTYWKILFIIILMTCNTMLNDVIAEQYLSQNIPYENISLVVYILQQVRAITLL